MAAEDIFPDKLVGILRVSASLVPLPYGRLHRVFTYCLASATSTTYEPPDWPPLPKLAGTWALVETRGGGLEYWPMEVRRPRETD